MVLLSTLAPITSRTGQRSTRRHTAAQLQFDSHHHLKVEWPMEHMVPNTLLTNASTQRHQQQNPTINTCVHVLFHFALTDISVSVVG